MSRRPKHKSSGLVALVNGIRLPAPIGAIAFATDRRWIYSEDEYQRAMADGLSLVDLEQADRSSSVLKTFE